MSRPLLALITAAALVLSGHQEPAPEPEVELYPPVRNASMLRFFALEGDLEVDALRKALEGLSTQDQESRALFGPTTSSTRPDKQYVVFELPADRALKDVVKALKKCGVRVVELEWTLFRGAPDEPTPILGFAARDCVIGMASDVRWFEFSEGKSAFFYLSGKLGAEELEDRYHKLYQPLGGGQLGELASDTFTWLLAEPLDEAAARRAEKGITKVPGVRGATIDVASRTLRVSIALDRLSTSAPLTKSGDKQSEVTKLFPRFDTNPILDELEKQSLATAPLPKKAGSEH